MANYTTGDLILYNNQSYAIVEKVMKDGTYELRIGSRFIQNVTTEEINRIKITPQLLARAGFMQEHENSDLWFWGKNSIRLLSKVDDPNEFEVMVGIKNSQDIGGTIYFFDYFDQLQEFYKKVFNTDLPTSFSYTLNL